MGCRYNQTKHTINLEGKEDKADLMYINNVEGHSTQLSYLWWMPKSVCKGSGTVLKWDKGFQDTPEHISLFQVRFHLLQYTYTVYCGLG